jgi:glycosyltransferase involved in cell wall biosynthesis
MKNRIIAIGMGTDQKNNIFSGQAMMFVAFIDFLKSQSYDVIIINLVSKYSDLKVGSIALKRIIEYISIILKAIKIFLNSRKSIVYITTAQSKGGFYRDFIFINLAKLFKCKVVIQQFGSNFSNFYDGLSKVMKFFVRYTFNKGSIIIVEGDYSRDQFKILKDHAKKVVAISNGLPEKDLRLSFIGKQYERTTSFNLLYLSYMIESKGYWDVLLAMHILVNEMKQNVRCTFSGIFKTSIDNEMFKNETDAKESFFNFIKENSLESYITYYEGVRGEIKANQFVNSHVFLLPSYFKFEGQPVSVLEAMAYGSVPVVTAHRMIPDMVTVETGIFVDPRSPEKIANSIKYLINNPEHYTKLSQACINRYLEYFTLEKYCLKLMSAVKSIK